jgi:hypothetical protein
MSGTGKSTVLKELHGRGHLTLDTDYGGWVLADGTWDEPRLSRFLDEHADCFVSGTVENQRRFYDRFEHVVLLSAPAAVILRRVTARANNPYGKSSGEQAEIMGYLQSVEPLLRRGATLELDARLPVAELANVLERLEQSPAGRTRRE